MKKGICIKCDSHEIYKRTRNKWGLSIPHSIPLSGIIRALVVDYICSSCGYIEEYVEDEKSLKSIKDKWGKV